VLQEFNNQVEMRVKLKTVLIVATFLAGLNAHAQLELNADFRTLGEIRHGYMQPATDTSVAASFVSQRSRVILKFKQDKLSLKFSVQDVRTWGEDDQYTGSGTFGDSGSLQAAESWLKYSFTDSIYLKLGRQVWAYDEQRILSGRNRNQYGLFYDAALFSWTAPKLQFDAGASFNNTGQNLYNVDYYTDKNKFQSLNFLYLKHKPTEKMHWSAIALATGYNDASSRNSLNFMYTGGLTATMQAGDAQVHGEAYYQTGQNNKGADVSAYFFTANATYKLADGKIVPGVGIDYYSGHDASNTDADYSATDHGFDVLYGARFKYNGNMNQFMFIGKPYEKGGLQDIYATLELKPLKKHILKAQLHSFALTSAYAAPESMPNDFVEIDRNLGVEADMIYIYKLAKNTKFNLGLSYLSVSESLDYLKGQAKLGDAPSYYIWASLQYTPQLFKTTGSKN